LAAEILMWLQAAVCCDGPQWRRRNQCSVHDRENTEKKLSFTPWSYFTNGPNNNNINFNKMRMLQPSAPIARVHLNPALIYANNNYCRWPIIPYNI